MGKLLSYLAAVVVVALMVGTVQAKEKEKGDKPGKGPETVFAKKDKDSDGKLTLDEFLGKIPAEKADKAKARFAKLDKDGSGDLSLDEFKAGFTKKGGDKKDKDKKEKKEKKEKKQKKGDE
ncbi:hypothetical protein HED60_11055 [Planctomycetales bacterium ZRK34]|nr:hypothetical protein HED60_11055 [Planctomycetales bacterium ZRK34]